MARYDELTTRLGDFLLGNKRLGRPALIDPYEHGVKTKNGPRPINLKSQLENKRIGHPKKCSRTNIREHIAFRQTHYYRSNGRSGFALLNIDIDAHDGETDALSVAETIEQFYFPDSYYEPSTNGKGCHHFLLIFLPRFQSCRKLNALLKAFGIALREIMIRGGFRAAIDIKPCKTFSLYVKKGEGYVPDSMGHLAKMPRPRTLEGMARLENAPIVHYANLLAVIEEYKRLRGRDHDQQPTEAAEPTTPEVATPSITVGNTHRSESSEFPGMDASCPLSRAVHAVMALARQLGRMPSVSEGRSFYEASRLATGMSAVDIQRRKRRISHAIDYVGRTFDVERAGKGISFSSLLPLIKKYVLPEHRMGTKYAYRITDEDLAVTLHVIELASFERKTKRDEQWTVGNDRIIAMFKALKRSPSRAAERGKEGCNNTCVGAHSMEHQARGCDRHKSVAMKLILSRAGLSEEIDSSYRPSTFKRKPPQGGEEGFNDTCVREHTIESSAWSDVGNDGRCKRYAVGHNHPRRQEFDRLYDELVHWVLTGGKDRKSTTPEMSETVTEMEL